MKYLKLILLLLVPTISLCQLSTSVMSPASLVQNVLLGSGVTVSNISYTGIGTSIGYFDGSSTNLGIGQGVVLTTGTIVNNGDGPHGPNNKSGAGIDIGTPGYPLLSAQIGGTTYNATVLEFDFIPYSDTVRFKYVFGSEEYPEYVGTQFNDVFGFFISGPGIAGLQNIAKLPNGSVVAINNVNSGSNSSYFVSNGDGNTSPQNSSSYYIQYDGFTKVLTAESKVQCGQTYHLIIAIADTGDGILDSGIFLEANSLSSNTPIEVTHTISQNLFNNTNILGESCVTGTVTIDRGPNNLNVPLTIPINVSGTAIEGTDYTNIPNSITFPAGIRQVSFSFDALGDALLEGQESLIISFLTTDPCGNQNNIDLTLFINDIQPVDIEIQGNQMLCPGDDITLTAVSSGGGSPYTYNWSTGSANSSITVSPTSNTIYSVTVTDACLNQSATAEFEVIVPVFDPVTINVTPDITEICPYIPANLSVSASGGSGLYTYEWSTAQQGIISNNSSVNVIPSTTTLYNVTVSDQCGNTATDNVLYTITSPPLLLSITPPDTICPGDSVYIEVVPTGGYGNYYYSWNNGATTQGIWVNPIENSNYTVVVHDECATFTVSSSTSITVIEPTANFEVTSATLFNGLALGFHNLSSGAVIYVWDFDDGNTSTNVNTTNTFTDPGVYYVSLVAINYLGCKDTIVKPIGIEEEWYVYIPNTFTPDGDRHNNTFKAKTIGINELSIAIYNRWGQTVFTSNDIDFSWDGTYDGVYVNDGVYTYVVKFLTNSGRERTIAGHVNVLR